MPPRGRLVNQPLGATSTLLEQGDGERGRRERLDVQSAEAGYLVRGERISWSEKNETERGKKKGRRFPLLSRPPVTHKEAVEFFW